MVLVAVVDWNLPRSQGEESELDEALTLPCLLGQLKTLVEEEGSSLLQQVGRRLCAQL